MFRYINAKSIMIVIRASITRKVAMETFFFAEIVTVWILNVKRIKIKLQKMLRIVIYN